MAAILSKGRWVYGNVSVANGSGLGNGMVPNGCQASTWINYYPVLVTPCGVTWPQWLSTEPLPELIMIYICDTISLLRYKTMNSLSFLISYFVISQPLCEHMLTKLCFAILIFQEAYSKLILGLRPADVRKPGLALISMLSVVHLLGCDRHLLALFIIAEEEGLPLPEIYTDPAWTKRWGT